MMLGFDDYTSLPDPPACPAPLPSALMYTSRGSLTRHHTPCCLYINPIPKKLTDNFPSRPRGPFFPALGLSGRNCEALIFPNPHLADAPFSAGSILPGACSVGINKSVWTCHPWRRCLMYGYCWFRAPT